MPGQCDLSAPNAGACSDSETGARGRYSIHWLMETCSFVLLRSLCGRQVNDAHLENDLNARLGPNSIPLNTSFGGCQGGLWKECLSFQRVRSGGSFMSLARGWGASLRRVLSKSAWNSGQSLDSVDFLLIDIYVTDPLWRLDEL